MSKPKSNTNILTWSLLIAGVAFLAFFVGGYFFIIFAPVVAYYLWYTYRKTQELERRLAELEKH